MTIWLPFIVVVGKVPTGLRWVSFNRSIGCRYLHQDLIVIRCVQGFRRRPCKLIGDIPFGESDVDVGVMGCVCPVDPESRWLPIVLDVISILEQVFI